MSTRRTKRLAVICAIIFLTAIAAVLQTDLGSSAANYLWTKLRGRYTVNERVQMYGETVATRLRPEFDAAAIAYPPRELAFVAFKDTARLQVYARALASEAWHRVREYPILGMSGGPGPKLRAGDRQVPEGVYRAEFLNANSRYLVVDTNDTETPLQPPPGYAWASLAQLTELTRHGHYLNVEARTLLACLNAMATQPRGGA